MPRNNPRAEETEEEESGLEITRTPREPAPLTVAGLARRAAAAPAMRALLAGAIDYAGLFPPAGLSMNQAVRNYMSYRAGPASWALARFVAPVARLGDLHTCVAGALPDGSPWRVAALAGRGGADEWELAATFTRGPLLVDALEVRARSADEVVTAAHRFPAGLDVFYEIPIDVDPKPLVSAIARVGGKAKVRTGGVAADAFPRATDLARFIVTCARAGVPFKATAGLHHAVRAAYPLTYDVDSPREEMFGFLNVLLGSAFAAAGFGTQDVSDLLVETNASAFRFAADGVEWRGRRLTTETLAQARASLALSLGSCSFTEPIEELQALGLL